MADKLPTPKEYSALMRDNRRERAEDTEIEESDPYSYQRDASNSTQEQRHPVDESTQTESESCKVCLLLL